MGSPRGADGLPKVDVDSPRIIAAMKVTGIGVMDITEPVLADAADIDNRTDGEQRRAELMERKRKHLLQELDNAAKALDDTLVEAILSPKSVDAALAQDAKSLLDQEKQKIDASRDRCKSDMQKELEREMGRKFAYEGTQKGREEWRKRAKEKHDEKAQHLAELADINSKRLEKAAEAMRKVKKDEWDEKKETMKKIGLTNDRVVKQAEERREVWAALGEERSKKMAEIAQKSLDIQRVDEEESYRKARERATKQAEREERMTAAAKEALDVKRAKDADKMGSVNDLMIKQQGERETMFKANTERLNSARASAAERQAEIAERCRATRAKEMEKWQVNRAAGRKEHREKCDEIRKEISDSFEKSITVREKYVEETVYAKAEMKGCMSELVGQNKARLARAGECTREQILAKVRHTKDKMSARDSDAKAVADYRTNAVRDEMRTKTQMHELKTLIQDASPKRVNQLLKELDLPLLAAQGVKEETEEEEKQKKQ